MVGEQSHITFDVDKIPVQAGAGDNSPETIHRPPEEVAQEVGSVTLSHEAAVEHSSSAEDNLSKGSPLVVAFEQYCQEQSHPWNKVTLESLGSFARSSHRFIREAAERERLFGQRVMDEELVNAEISRHMLQYPPGLSKIDQEKDRERAEVEARFVAIATEHVNLKKYPEIGIAVRLFKELKEAGQKRAMHGPLKTLVAYGRVIDSSGRTVRNY